MKIKSLILAFLLLSGFNGVYGAISYYSDTLKSDLTLNDLDTIVLTDTVVVASGVTLMVNSGAVVQAGGATVLQINGNLDVNGVDGNNAKFIPQSNERWNGIVINEGGKASIAGAFIDSAFYGIHIKSDSVVISLSEISNCEKYGIYSEGNLIIDNSKIHNNTEIGICFDSYTDTLAISNSLICNNNVGDTTSFGIYLYGRVKAYHNTIADNGDYGLYIRYPRSIDTIQNCIIARHDYGLYGESNYYGRCQSINNNVWNNSIENTFNMIDSSLISENPLFVSSADYNITHRSPSRMLGYGGTYQGAYPWSGAISSINCGYIWADTVFSGNQAIVGDLTVAEGVTLTLTPGTVMTFTANSDVMNADTADTLSGLIVRGNLIADGTKFMNITMTSNESSAGNWEGVTVLSSGNTTLDNVKLSNAVNGVWLESSLTSVTSSEVSNCSGYGIYCTGAITVNNCEIHDNYGNGVHQIGNSDGVIVTNSLIYNNNKSNSNGHGIYAYSALKAVNNTVVNNGKYGISCIGSLNKDTVMNCIVTGHTYGLYRITNDIHNNLWDNDTINNFDISSVGSISDNPLFVSSTNFNLTHRSPGRKMGFEGSHQGALPWAGAMTQKNEGYLWEDTIFSGDNSFTGYLIVPDSTTLTLSPGTILTFPVNGGLNVYGDLIANGTKSTPISFTSNDTSAGSWDGITIFSDSTKLDYTKISNAVYGVFNRAEDFVITNSEILNCLEYGVSNYGGLTISSSKVYNNHMGGIYQDSTKRVLDISSCVVYDNGHSNVYGFGIYVFDGLIKSINNTVVDNCHYGMFLRGYYNYYIINNCIITENRYGISIMVTVNGEPHGYNNNVWNNSTENLYGFINENPLNEDPLFVNRDHNIFNLLPSSPCVDAGSYGYGFPSTDADGFPRPVPGVPGGAATIDVGAFEFTLNANRHPMPNPGSDTAVVINETVYLSGVTSTDADGHIVSYEWEFGDGTIASGETVSHTYDSNGDYTVTLKVTDNDGLFNYATKNVHVNTRPVAMAGLDKYADIGEDIYFDATGSTDSDGSVVDWKWYFGDGDSSLTSQVYHQYTVPGVYKAVTVVTDDDGADDSDTVLVTVYGPDPVAPEIVSSNKLNAKQGDEATYTASAIDANGTIPTISFHNIPSWMTVAGNEIKGTPSNSDGDTSFTIIASDGVLKDTLVVNVYVEVLIVPVQIIQNPNNQDKYGGDTALFYVRTTGGAPISYQWQELISGMSEWVDMTGENSDTLTFIVSKDDIGSYRCIASNQTGIDTSTGGELTYRNSSPVLTAVSPQTINEDGSLTVMFSMMTALDIDETLNDNNIRIIELDGANYSVAGNVITPDADWFGVLTVPMYLIDNDGSTSADTLNCTLTVNSVNDLPVLEYSLSDTISGVGVPFEREIPNDLFSDVDDDLLDITALDMPYGFTFADGIISGIPTMVRDYSIIIAAQDDSNAIVSDTFVLSIQPITEITTVDDNVTGKECGITAAPNIVKQKDLNVQLLISDELSGEGTIVIFDNQGDVIDKQNISVNGGGHFNWNLTNMNGIPVTSGIYVAVLTIEDKFGNQNRFTTKIGVRID